MEEMQRVRLQHLAEMQQAAKFGCSRSKLIHADDLVDRFRCRQLMADRADAAQALHKKRHFPERATLDEFLETAEFNDMKSRLDDVIVIVDQQCDLAVSFDARDWIDGDAAGGGRRGGFVRFHDDQS